MGDKRRAKRDDLVGLIECDVGHGICDSQIIDALLEVSVLGSLSIKGRMDEY